MIVVKLFVRYELLWIKVPVASSFPCLVHYFIVTTLGFLFPYELLWFRWRSKKHCLKCNISIPNIEMRYLVNVTPCYRN